MDTGENRPNGQLTPPVEKSSIHWPSVCQLGGSLLGIFFLWVAAMVLLMICATGVTSGMPAAQINLNSILLVTAGFAWMGILLVPSAYYAGKRLFQHNRSDGHQNQKPQPYQTAMSVMIPLIGMMATVWIGDILIRNTRDATYILPFLHVLAISFPILWVYNFGSAGLSQPNPGRLWGAFAVSLTLGPLVIMLLEVAAMVIFIGCIILLILSRPDWTQTLVTLVERLSHVPNETVLSRVLTPYLIQPSTLIAVLVFAAVIVPLIEEAFKPLGLWFFLGRGITPSRGLMLGMACGAAYAMFESLLMAATPLEWTTVVLGRAATSLLHVTNCGLVGWGMALAYGSRGEQTKIHHRRAQRQLLLLYMLAVTIHGLWNGLTLFGVWMQFNNHHGMNSSADGILSLNQIAPWMLSVFTLVVVAILIGANILVRRDSEAHNI